MSTGKRYNLCCTAMAFVHEDSGQMEESNSEVPIDRISSLPDELLINILNFLPINYAITTSILSTRWTNLYKEVTYLDIDDSFLSDSHSAFRYVSCICKMLDVANLSKLISFRLKCKRCQLATVIRCLDVMVHHRIQEIDLCIPMTFRFPDSMFTCKTLRILKLTGCFAVDNVPDTVCLPCLKILHLKKIRMLNADNISRICRILSGCPLLQEFLMTPLNWHKLTLSKALVVSPLLQFFDYEDNLAESYSIKTSNYLVEAHLGIPIEFDYVNDLSRVSRSARDLVQAVSSVKCLFLSADCIQVLISAQDELPILRNLTKLKLGCSKNPYLTLLRLLGIAPNLEELIFSEGLFPVPLRDIFPLEQDYWASGRAAPSCLKTHLKTIEIEHLTGLKEELRIVEYLLRNSHVLEQLIIHKWVGSEEKFKIRKQLKGLAKRWNKCVKFCELYL